MYRQEHTQIARSLAKPSPSQPRSRRERFPKSKPINVCSRPSFDRHHLDETQAPPRRRRRRPGSVESKRRSASQADKPRSPRAEPALHQTYCPSRLAILGSHSYASQRPQSYPQHRTMFHQAHQDSGSTTTSRAERADDQAPRPSKCLLCRRFCHLFQQECNAGEPIRDTTLLSPVTQLLSQPCGGPKLDSTMSHGTRHRGGMNGSCAAGSPTSHRIPTYFTLPSMSGAGRALALMRGI